MKQYTIVTLFNLNSKKIEYKVIDADYKSMQDSYEFYNWYKKDRQFFNSKEEANIFGENHCKYLNNFFK